MLIEEIINQIYQSMLNTILHGVSEDDKEEISNNYLLYLHNRYDKNTVTKDNKSELLNALLKREKIIWGYRSFYTKINMLKKDNAFSTISKLSNDAFKLAVRRLENPDTFPISEEDAKKNIDEMIANLDNVSKYNSTIASELVSEGILDYYYASSDTNDTSLRLHSYKTT